MIVESEILVVGLDRSGKSSLARCVGGAPNPMRAYRQTPTPDRIIFNKTVTILDCPGGAAHRCKWGDNVGPATRGIVACVDATDGLRLALAWSEIISLSHRHPRVPLLVLFTHQDEPRALRVHEALDVLGDFAPFPSGVKVAMFGVSLATGDGVDETRQWICAL